MNSLSLNLQFTNQIQNPTNSDFYVLPTTQPNRYMLKRWGRSAHAHANWQRIWQLLSSDWLRFLSYQSHFSQKWFRWLLNRCSTVWFFYNNEMTTNSPKYILTIFVLKVSIIFWTIWKVHAIILDFWQTQAKLGYKNQ